MIGGVQPEQPKMQTLTVTVITLLEVDGNPEPVHDVVPGLKGGPSTRLKDTADEEEFEPILESGEREQDGRESRDGRFLGEGVGDVCDVCREVAKVHDASFDEEGDVRVVGEKGEKRPSDLAVSTLAFITVTGHEKGPV